jgi:hypothetical protein
MRRSEIEKDLFMPTGKPLAFVLSAILACGSTADAQIQSRDQQACINTVNKGAIAVGAQQGRDNLACLKDAAADKLGTMTAQQCLTADRKGRVAKRIAKLTAAEADKCNVTPNFAYTGSGNASDSERAGSLLSFTDVFTANADSAILDCDTDTPGCRCQKAAAAATEKLMQLKSKTFANCKKQVLAAGAASAAEVAKCIDDAATEGSIAADPRGRIQKTVENLTAKIDKHCDQPGVTGTALASHAECAGLQGAALASCIDQVTSCRSCQTLTAVDDLVVDCDLFDNGVADSSCAALTLCFPPTSVCDDGQSCTINDTCTAVGCTGTQLVAGSAAAITRQITSIDGNDQVHLLVEIITISFQPLQLTAVDVDYKPGLALESLTTECAVRGSDQYRCEHTMSFLATSACNGTGDYHLYLTHSCTPSVAGCSICSDPRTIDFSLTTENWCDVSTVLTCGNSQIDFGEVCDGANLNGKTCVTQGYPGGSLACDSNCEFDTGGCQAPRAFITSTTYDGNLGGLSGADNKCQTQAGAAALGGTWKAWLSSSSTDARERIPAMRYQTMNGGIITADGTNLYGGGLAADIASNEFNGSVSGTAWTGTGTDGSKTTDRCSDWAATTGNGTVGNNSSTMQWTNDASPASCAGMQRLYCFEQPSYKRVFVTSTTYTGALGGLAGADAKCQTRANAGNLGGTWRAFLSTASVNAKDRIPNAEYRLIDLSTVVATSKADLTDGMITNNIQMDETGALRASFVWTGSNNDGTSNGGNCNGWNSQAQNIFLGRNDDPAQWALASTIGACGNTLRLYCFEE